MGKSCGADLNSTSVSRTSFFRRVNSAAMATFLIELATPPAFQTMFGATTSFTSFSPNAPFFMYSAVVLSFNMLSKRAIMRSLDSGSFSTSMCASKMSTTEPKYFPPVSPAILIRASKACSLGFLADFQTGASSPPPPSFLTSCTKCFSSNSGTPPREIALSSSSVSSLRSKLTSAPIKKMKQCRRSSSASSPNSAPALPTRTWQASSKDSSTSLSPLSKIEVEASALAILAASVLTTFSSAPSKTLASTTRLPVSFSVVFIPLTLPSTLGKRTSIAAVFPPNFLPKDLATASAPSLIGSSSSRTLEARQLKRISRSPVITLLPSCEVPPPYSIKTLRVLRLFSL
mmetsp:Transcript_14318/g.29441  ORF Transcript_14318/g.29441 Transcript_14318/m.29441 type:complete len:345 (+) Transcript_14318:474-1508(+)